MLPDEIVGNDLTLRRSGGNTGRQRPNLRIWGGAVVWRRPVAVAVVTLAQLVFAASPVAAHEPVSPYANNSTHYVYKYNVPGSVSTATDRWVLTDTERSASKDVDFIAYVTSTHDTADVSIAWEVTANTSAAGDYSCVSVANGACQHAHVRVNPNVKPAYGCCSAEYQAYYDFVACAEITHSVLGTAHNDSTGPTCNLTQGPSAIYTDSRYWTTNADDDTHLREIYER